jgi:hypothetical protein
MDYLANDFTNTITFIKAYRAMEERSLPENKKLIKSIVDADQFKHLYESWAGRKNDFSSFFLNLSYKTQADFIISFGIDVPGYNDYLVELTSNHTAYAYATPPILVSQFHELVKFFYNNGIHENAVSGIKLNYLPTECYGNSKNWGNYILSLVMPYQLSVLKQIAYNSIENIKSSEENRSFIKNAIQR